MAVLLLFDPVMTEHDPGPGHPESPDRLQAIWRDLSSRPVAGTQVAAPPKATREELQRVHDQGYVARILELRGRELQLDPDTATSAASVDAALLAAGAAAEAVRRVLNGNAESAFALVRPPGHHAESTRAMGFCLFNNVAVAAAEAHARGLSRVLCVDWDVHHGNGTQHSYYARRDLLFCSTHQYPLYPGTGHELETGTGAGEGFTVNVPLPAGCGDADYSAAFADLLLPIGDAYRPELVLVSAGFDAHRDDPLAGMEVSEDGFAALCGAVKQIADRHCPGRLVLTLEGGYDLQALSRSVRGCIEVLAGAEAPPLRGQVSRAAHALREVRAAQAPYWRAALG
ncbi:MAG TPA: histone deacetylase [Myxococcales bacterium]|nr:histone deacetylase [Myxococcales bacterium]